jgi:hypothetical protein
VSARNFLILLAIVLILAAPKLRAGQDQHRPEQAPASTSQHPGPPGSKG